MRQSPAMGQWLASTFVSKAGAAKSPDDQHYISLGAGVQSSTLALMAALGEITPMPQAAIFADTHAEPKAVYEWLEYLESVLPFPVAESNCR